MNKYKRKRKMGKSKNASNVTSSKDNQISSPGTNDGDQDSQDDIDTNMFVQEQGVNEN